MYWLLIFHILPVVLNQQLVYMEDLEEGEIVEQTDIGVCKVCYYHMHLSLFNLCQKFISIVLWGP